MWGKLVIEASRDRAWTINSAPRMVIHPRQSIDPRFYLYTYSLDLVLPTLQLFVNWFGTEAGTVEMSGRGAQYINSIAS